jgi:hypothetical protein
MPRIVSLLINIVAVGAWLALIGYLLVRSELFGWDFHIYQQAGQAFLAHKDPLDDPYLVHVGKTRAYLPFVYPPLAVFPFLAFASLSKASAFYIWVALEAVGLAWLIKVWKRSFVDFSISGKWAIALLLLFNGTVYSCFATGNFALFEALSLFLAMEALLRKNDEKCAGLLVFAACFKVLPIFYLGLLPFLGGKNRIRATVYGIFAFGLYLALNLALYPRPTMEFVQVAMTRSDNRNNNPSLLAFFEDLSSRAPVMGGREMYLIAVAGIIATSILAIRRWKDPDPAVRLLFILLVISFVLPRFMIYSYIQLIPAGWLALREVRGLARWATLALLCAVLPGSFLLMSRPLWSAALEQALGMQIGVWGYASLYGAIAIWGIFLAKIIKPPSREMTPTGG